jgi:HK97 family phage prohead protease
MADHIRKPHHSALRRPEVRFLATPDMEVRTSVEQGSTDIVLTGTPIVYGVDYQVMGMTGPFSERMEPGVAAGVLQRGDNVIFAFNHDRDAVPLASVKSGTLQLSDSSASLRCEAHLDADNPQARAVASAIRRGDVDQMSVGFTVQSDSWTDGASQRSRSIAQLGSMLDVSAVTFPASPSTSIEVAQRMLTLHPDETFADFDRLIYELRNGQQMSTGSQSALIEAVQGLHAALTSAGMDPQMLSDATDADTIDDSQDDADDGEDRTETQPVDDAEVRALSLAVERELAELDLLAL